MIFKGKTHKFGNDVSTDLICPGRYFHLRNNLPELARHTLEDADKDFVTRVKPGDFVVAGRNFGCGSSREHAPRIIKLNGIKAVLAKSFARIFYRNAINIGLLVLECDTDNFDQNDILEIDLSTGQIQNLTKNLQVKFQSLPEVMIKLISDGGLVEHIKKYGDFKL